MLSTPESLESRLHLSYFLLVTFFQFLRWNGKRFFCHCRNFAKLTWKKLVRPLFTTILLNEVTLIAGHQLIRRDRTSREHSYLLWLPKESFPPPSEPLPPFRPSRPWRILWCRPSFLQLFLPSSSPSTIPSS